MTPLRQDVMIIGAGASGLMCAIACARRGRRTVLLDHAARAGSKILVSGGGRCNFTNLRLSADDYFSGNPHFVKSALARYTPWDFVEFLARHGAGYEEKEAGQLFCASGASEVLRALEEEARGLGARFALGETVRGVDKDGEAGRFKVETDKGIVESESLVVATGGLSWPQIGATNLGYRIAKRFGHAVTPLRPGLVPLLAGAQDEGMCRELSGVSAEVIVRLGRREFSGSLLFTHRGLSGPAVLQASSLWREGEALTVEFLPGLDVPGELERARTAGQTLAGWLGRHLPRRLAQALAGRLGVAGTLSGLPNKEIRRLADRLADWEFMPAGSEGFGKAEVTMGGVDTGEISSKTMESAKVPGLYFTGEVLDVTGRLGGYNLQWAWSSGHAAGQAA